MEKLIEGVHSRGVREPIGTFKKTMPGSEDLPKKIQILKFFLINENQSILYGHFQKVTHLLQIFMV